MGLKGAGHVFAELLEHPSSRTMNLLLTESGMAKVLLSNLFPPAIAQHVDYM